MVDTVTDRITKDQVKKWKLNDTVIISAGTGKGKSHFIKNRLYEIAKEKNGKILFLIHRSNCISQFQNEIDRDNKSDIIHIKSYQSIDSADYKGNTVDLSEYTYIVCDEFHYFISDASFNYLTDISFKHINETSSAVKIFMSATGDEVTKYLKRVGCEIIQAVDMKPDYRFISKLIFFKRKNSDNKFDEVISNAMQNNEKVIIFIDNIEEAYNLYKRHKNYSLFNCSKGRIDMYRHVDKEKINNMLFKEMFNESVLITTSAMDAGVNIKDEKVKHIIIAIKDFGSLIQCLGRKRILNKNDKVNVYIRSISNSTLSNMKNRINEKIEKAEFILSGKSMSLFLEKYKRDTEEHGLIYDEFATDDTVYKRVNDMMFFKLVHDRIRIYQMMKGEDGYNEFVAIYFDKFLNQEYSCESKDKRVKKKNDIEKYLLTMIGKEMIEIADRTDLISMLDVKIDSKQKSSLIVLNKELEKMELPYEIKKKSGYRTINNIREQYRSIWIIEKVG